MKLGNRPRFHMNLFGVRCPRWPCVQGSTTSSSLSAHSISLPDNHTSSWTYIHYQANSANSNNTGSSLNDNELISLINQEEDTEDVEQESNSNDAGAVSSLFNLNSSDRHVRTDVRTLFPEGTAQHLDGNWNAVESCVQNRDTRELCALSECQYVNLPIRTDLSRSRDCIPVYSAGQSSCRSTSSHGSSSGASSQRLDSGDWAVGGDHPYGIPSTLLGGVLLNLDDQFRLSSNAEWQNWSEFLTSAQEPDLGAAAGEDVTQDNIPEDIYTSGSIDSTHDAASSSNECNSLNNSINNVSTNEVDDNIVHNPLPAFSFPQFALPPPPSSISTTSSGSSGSVGRLRQQEWYFYDPRLVSDQRTERVTLDTSFRGLHNRCIMSSIIQPPAYDDIIQEAGVDIMASRPGSNEDLPPPYIEHLPSEPPPSYDQSFGHTLAFPTFHTGFHVNPLGRRLAASLCMVPLPMTAISVPEPDLLTGINIDELLDGPVDNRNETNQLNTCNNSPASSNIDLNSGLVDMNVNDESDGEVLMESCSDEEDLLLDEDGPTNGEAHNSQLSIRRYPVGFCLGRRPPLRWSRGMSPNRWTPENWAANQFQ